MFYECCLFSLLTTFAHTTDKNVSRSLFPDSSSENNFSYFSKELFKPRSQSTPASTSSGHSPFPRSGSSEKFQIRENNSVVGGKASEPRPTGSKNKKFSAPPEFARKNLTNSNSGKKSSKNVRLSAMSDSYLETGGSSRVISPITLRDNYNPSNVGSTNWRPVPKKNYSDRLFPIRYEISCQKSEEADDCSYLSCPPEDVIFGQNKDRQLEKNIGKLRIGTINYAEKSEMNPGNSWKFIPKNIQPTNRNSSVKNLSKSKKPPPEPIIPMSVIPRNSVPETSSTIPAFVYTNEERRIGFEGVGIVSIGYKLCACGGTDASKRNVLPLMAEICLLDRQYNVLYEGYVKYTDAAVKGIHKGMPKECDTLGKDVEVVERNVKEHISGNILVSFNIGRLVTILNFEHPAYYIRDIQSLARFRDVLCNLRFQTLKGIYGNFINDPSDEGTDDSAHTRAVQSLNLYLLFENRWNSEVVDLMRRDKEPSRKVNARTYALTSAPKHSHGFHLEGNYNSYVRILPQDLVAIHFEIVNAKINRATIIKLGKHIAGNCANPKYEDWSIGFPGYCSESIFSELVNKMCETLKFKVIVGYDVEKYVKGLCYGRILASELYDLKKIFGRDEEDVMHLASEYLHVEYRGYPSSKLQAKIAFQFYALFRFEPSEKPGYTAI